MSDYTKRVPKDLGDVGDLSKKQAEAEAERLREAIRHHDRRYYLDADPVISDAAYDRLFRRLQAIEERFPSLRRDDSPTMRVGGGPVDGLERVRHAAPMLSLDSTLEQDAVARFVAGVQNEANAAAFVLEPKFDGLSMEIVYEDGVFQRAVTRGDGQAGDDVSHAMRTVRSMPLRLEGDAPRRLAVRGEVYLPNAGFQELNKRRLERGDDAFANPRNAAAGTVRQLDPAAAQDVPLEIVFYDILDIDGASFETHQEVLDALRSWGLRTDMHNERATRLEDIVAYRERFIQQRDDLPYEVDGVIAKVDDLDLRERLGTRARSPRWAIAWKFPPREEETVLRDIVVSVGRGGNLTPVALMDPVDVGGVTVSRATLHNADQVQRLDVRPGDRVRVARAGDVIPQVVERIQAGKRRGASFSMPAQCPSCGADVVREGAYTVCPSGLGCPAQIKGRIIHYASRQALDIRGLGEEAASQLVDRDLVQDMSDLYDLSPDGLEALDGFAAKSAKNLHDAIQAGKHPDLHRFLFGLGIRHVGARIASWLADRFRSIDALRDASIDDVRSIDGIGDEVAGAVRDFFADERNQAILERLHDAGVRPRPPAEKGGDLAGKTFVFTGTLEDFTRAEAKAAVESRGGRVTSSVSGNTDYVVVGTDPGSKRDEAERHGVAIIDEAAFKKLL